MQWPLGKEARPFAEQPARKLPKLQLPPEGLRAPEPLATPRAKPNTRIADQLRRREKQCMSTEPGALEGALLEGAAPHRAFREGKSELDHYAKRRVSRKHHKTVAYKQQMLAAARARQSDEITPKSHLVATQGMHGPRKRDRRLSESEYSATP